jgi:acyl carrier protein
MLSEQEMKLASFFIAREGEGVVPLLQKMDLRHEGILDSLDMVALATHIEKHFGKKIDLTDPKILAAMNKFDDIMKVIRV